MKYGALQAGRGLMNLVRSDSARGLLCAQTCNRASKGIKVEVSIEKVYVRAESEVIFRAEICLCPAEYASSAFERAPVKA